MNTEEFKQSNIPKMFRVDDTEDYRAGMKIQFIGYDNPFIIMDILNEYDLAVLEVGILH